MQDVTEVEHDRPAQLVRPAQARMTGQHSIMAAQVISIADSRLRSNLTKNGTLGKFTLG